MRPPPVTQSLHQRTNVRAYFVCDRIGRPKEEGVRPLHLFPHSLISQEKVRLRVFSYSHSRTPRRPLARECECTSGCANGGADASQRRVATFATRPMRVRPTHVIDCDWAGLSQPSECAASEPVHSSSAPWPPDRQLCLKALRRNCAWRHRAHAHPLIVEANTAAGG